MKNVRVMVKPIHEMDSLEDDPFFSVFLQAIYKNAMQNPDQLKDGSEIFNERVKKLIEGVDLDEDE